MSDQSYSIQDKIKASTFDSSVWPFLTMIWDRPVWPLKIWLDMVYIETQDKESHILYDTYSQSDNKPPDNLCVKPNPTWT